VWYRAHTSTSATSQALKQLHDKHKTQKKMVTNKKERKQQQSHIHFGKVAETQNDFFFSFSLFNDDDDDNVVCVRGGDANVPHRG